MFFSCLLPNLGPLILKNAVNPLYLWVPYSRIQPSSDKKYSEEKIVSVLHLSLFHKQLFTRCLHCLSILSHIEVIQSIQEDVCGSQANTTPLYKKNLRIQETFYQRMRVLKLQDTQGYMYYIFPDFFSYCVWAFVGENH